MGSRSGRADARSGCLADQSTQQAGRKFSVVAVIQAPGRCSGLRTKHKKHRRWAELSYHATLNQAQRMWENGMHLTHIAEIIGVGRTTSYRQLNR
ncbi:helix-turn-helix domain-containing protein [Rhodococcus sp. IEGM 1379]|nr:helix-turn-helix domain-containing protein [Rhodococcus sp. IEGM 1379]MDI9913864.1 helix-turn-helix domain-containing protein [Rhodococcus sp. IEGM 1379]